MSTMDEVISLCKRRGFVYPGSEIYGGLANTWDYGPYGAVLKRNIVNLWWKSFIEDRDDMLALDSAILMNPRVWEASGHIANFADPLMDCKNCKERVRGDKILEEHLKETIAGLSNQEIYARIMDAKIPCPKCGKVNWTEPRAFNLMFKTYQGVVEDTAEQIYLRPETAQGIFVNFKNILDSMRVRLPFGVGQVGKSFRNEITPGNFIFRTREFEQMEIEYFVRPEDSERAFDQWVEDFKQFFVALGIPENKLRLRYHEKDELSHYSSKTVDFEYEYPFGWGELMGIAHRGSFDLDQHSKFSGEKLQYRDPVSNEVFVPHTVEPALGLTRSVLIVLLSAYEEQELEGGEKRTVMHFAPALAPVQVAVFPLQKQQSEAASKLYKSLKKSFRSEYDESGAIGKRYRRQDEIGTPFCVTYDFQSDDDAAVTVRERDSMKQERVKMEDLEAYLSKRLL
ncbi:MAG: glycine--tRNA ligase [Candidatus Gracilibacteria bacterium]|jgi:glycyl-tRNA synthetase